MNRLSAITLSSCLIFIFVASAAAGAPGAQSGIQPAAIEDGSIGGNVLYQGVIAGTPDVDVLLFDNLAAEPLTSVHVPFPGGPYRFGEGPDGTYYVGAQIDPDDSGGPPDPGEPFAWYDANLDGAADAITITGGDASSIDILLPATPSWSHESEQGGAYFGDAVSAGDFNGDGFEDVVVGARLFDQPGGYTDAGRAYLFYGEAGGLSDMPQIIDPPVLDYYGFFGEVAASAGDVNGDNIDDLLITMPNYNQTLADEGAVFVWYGSENGIEGGYDWMARGAMFYAHLGLDFGAGTAGDVNGDGYDDIIAGAVRYDFNDVAHAFVWFGSETGLGDPGTPANADWTAAAPTGLSGADNCNWFGFVVGTAGDVDNDGFDDVFVGARGYQSEAAQDDEGAVFVWYGSESGLGDPGTLENADWSVEGEQAGARLGYHAAAAGDVDGDGYDDFLVGAYLYHNGATNEGLIQLFYGSEDGLETAAGWTAEGMVDNMLLGLNVGTGADYNGDGYDDVAAGAHGFDVAAVTPVPNAGAALIWYGGPTGPGAGGTPLNADYLATGDGGNVYLGYRMLQGRADLNQDGLHDLVLGNLHYEVNQTADSGRVLVYDGVPDPITGLSAVNDSPTLLGAGTAFTATVSAGTGIAYTWDFDDGQAGEGAIAPHTYEAAGVYTATVTASNAVHSRSAQTVVVVEAAISGLAASNDGPTLISTPTTLSATIAAGDGATYSWDFGDGENGTGAVVQHTYADTGAYVATVTAVNSVSSATAITTVVVEPRRLFLPTLVMALP